VSIQVQSWLPSPNGWPKDGVNGSDLRKDIKLTKHAAEQRISLRKTTVISPWLALVERSVLDSQGAQLGSFHGLALADYVSVIAVARNGTLPLVRQFRPAVERWTLEFPGGLLDEGEVPLDCAMRELSEEVGLRASHATSLGVFLPDSGRLGNRLWGFFVSEADSVEHWSAEPDIEVIWVTPEILEMYVRDGSFDHAPHLALFAVARVRGLL
jgi:ADP-ribose pyrophosphatase